MASLPAVDGTDLELRVPVDSSTPCAREGIAGRCCDCGYEGTGDAVCGRDVRYAHCDHWWEPAGFERRN